MIYSYLYYREKSAMVTGNLVPFSHLKCSLLIQNNFMDYNVEKNIRFIEKNREYISQSAEVLRGTVDDKGDFSITIPIFEDVVYTYVFWLGDDEFPTSANVLYDKNITEFLHAESVAILTGIGLARIRKAIELFL